MEEVFGQIDCNLILARLWASFSLKWSVPAWPLFVFMYEYINTVFFLSSMLYGFNVNAIFYVHYWYYWWFFMLIIVAPPYGGQVHFLHEFCSCSKSLQMVQQLRLFRYVACGAVQLDSWHCLPALKLVFSIFKISCCCLIAFLV